MWIYDGKLKLILQEKNGKLSGVQFAHVTEKLPQITEDIKLTPLLADAVRQLDEYFAGNRKIFDIPLYLEGSPFQLKVWEALQAIPYGEVVTYKDIADSIGNPKAVRAVGMANHHNPIAIIVPCHRVIGAGGKLVGYAGGLNIKQYLLDLESKNK